MRHIMWFAVSAALLFAGACSSETNRTLPDDFGNTDDINFDDIVPADADGGTDTLPKDDAPAPGDSDTPVDPDADITPPVDSDLPVDPDADSVQPDTEYPDGLNPDELWPDELWPDELWPDELWPDEIWPDEIVPDELWPDDIWPDDAQPDDAQPDDAQPDDAQPDDTQPDDTPVDNQVPDVDVPTPICTSLEIEDCPYTGDPATLNVGPCKAGTRQCAADGLSWSDCTGEVLPAISDVCTDSVDNDCNGTVNDGYDDGAAGCFCMPATLHDCYTGPVGTLDVGICHAGQQQCNTQGTGYGVCGGEQKPLPAEICGNGDDDNCNNQTDESIDADGDGYGTCGGDCCDSTAQCANPELVNPGAVEVEGDGIDNDCNGTTDEDPRTNCSSGAKFSGTTALNLVNGMDICKVSTGGSWGIVGTPTLTRADGTTCKSTCVETDQWGDCSDYDDICLPDNLQIALMEQFGTDASNIHIYGGNMAAISSGRARDANDPNATTEITYSYTGGTANPPADFTAAHGGQLPTTKAGCPNGSGANDGVLLNLQLKVPTNAQSFSFNFRFFSQEYMGYTCTEYNDFFIAMLYTGASGIPTDKNISFDSNGSYISVNSNAFFTVCSPKSGYTCPDGTAPLNGTGYPAANAGATKWLSTTAPVVPGETITLKFVVWDTSDQALDSLVLIDNFKWSAQGTSGPVTFECWDLNKNGTCDVASEDQSGDGVCNERDC